MDTSFALAPPTTAALGSGTQASQTRDSLPPSTTVTSTPGGSLGPQRAQAAPWTPAEREARDVLEKQLGLTSTDAILWSKLERMESNLRPIIGTNVNDSTNRHVTSLQNRLTDTSYARCVALNDIRMLKEDWRSSVPFTSQSNDLSAALRNVKMFDQVLSDTRVQIDRLLQKHPDLLTTPAVNPNPPRVI